MDFELLSTLYFCQSSVRRGGSVRRRGSVRRGGLADVCPAMNPLCTFFSCSTFFLVGPIAQVKEMCNPSDVSKMIIKICCAVILFAMIVLAFCAAFWVSQISCTLQHGQFTLFFLLQSNINPTKNFSYCSYPTSLHIQLDPNPNFYKSEHRAILMCIN